MNRGSVAVHVGAAVRLVDLHFADDDAMQIVLGAAVALKAKHRHVDLNQDQVELIATRLDNLLNEEV